MRRLPGEIFPMLSLLVSLLTFTSRKAEEDRLAELERIKAEEEAARLAEEEAARLAEEQRLADEEAAR